MKLPLQGGAYSARGLIANAQRCVNLYMEKNPPDSPAPFTYYPTPGLTKRATSPNNMAGRWTFRTSDNQLFVVNGERVYYVNSSFAYTYLGTLNSSTGPVSIQDNGLAIIIVDNTATGYAIDLITHTFAQINSPYFYGALKVDYLDTYFLFNKFGTKQWYISLSNCTYDMLTAATGAILSGTITAPGTLYTTGLYISVPLTGGTGSGATATITINAGGVTDVTIQNKGTGYILGDSLSVNAASVGGTGSGFAYNVGLIGGMAFDALDIASKTGYPDPIGSLIVMHREVWLVGKLTTEVWFNSGAPDFPFQIQAGVFIEHGILADYSLAAYGLDVFWLSQDKEGLFIVLRGSSYESNKVSTYALENEIARYAKNYGVTDAIGMTYQIEGHPFYVLLFPAADKAWVMDIDNGAWHEWNWLDNNGNLHRTRVSSICHVYGKIIATDWENGNLYEIDVDNYTDNGNPIPRIRSFPHMVNEMKRVTYDSFIADMQCGDDLNPSDSPIVTLRWSDNRGKSFGNGLAQTLGKTGDYLASPQWSRLGMARDRVFELSWSSAVKTALNGAFIDVTEAET